jgi:hypothetical protein
LQQLQKRAIAQPKVPRSAKTKRSPSLWGGLIPKKMLKDP